MSINVYKDDLVFMDWLATIKIVVFNVYEKYNRNDTRKEDNYVTP